MEQAAALTMSDRTVPPTREPTPAPAVTDAAAPSSTVEGSSADAAGVSGTPGSPEATARASSDTITDGTQRAVQRVVQHGFYAGSLEEEVGQVMGTLGSFWGGLKKKGASTLSSIKTDLDKTVAQVQEDFKHLQTANLEVARKDPAEWEAEQAAAKERQQQKAAEEAARLDEAEKDKGKGKEADPTAATDAAASATALLNRLTSSTSQLQTSLQSTLQSTLAAAKANPALSNPTQLRTQLAENLRLSSARENLTLSFHQAEKLAEEYLKKGEGWVKEAERGVGEWVKDAEKWVEDNVRVIPPEEGGETHVFSTGWDGEDWYSFTTSTASSNAGAAPGSILFDAAGGRTPRASMSAAGIAGSRKEALLRRLREDKELLLVDPAGEAETKERQNEFAQWVADKWPEASKTGREAEEGGVGGIRMALVPESLTDEQFWQRYLFHKHMIEAEEEKRKLLLQATQEQADDFSWDDDEDSSPSPASASGAGTAPRAESTTPTLPTGPADHIAIPAPPTASTAPAASAPVPAATRAAAPPNVVLPKGNTPKDHASTNTSPRDSEESYDLVSDRTAAPTEDDEDSDWE